MLQHLESLGAKECSRRRDSASVGLAFWCDALLLSVRRPSCFTMAPKEKRPKELPGRRWKHLAFPPTGGIEVSNASLHTALSSGKMEFTQEEIDGFKIGAPLEWKSFVKVGEELPKFYTPLRPPKKDPPVVVVAIGVFVLLSIYGFCWAIWKMVKHNYEFFSEVDVTSPAGAVTASGSAALAAIVLYYVFYPEGQLARDAVQDRGAGRNTFAHGASDRH